MKVIEVKTNDVTVGFTNKVIHTVYKDMCERENFDINMDSTNGDVYMNKKEAAIFTKMINSLAFCEHAIEGFFSCHEDVFNDMIFLNEHNEEPVCIGCMMNTINNLIQQIFRAIVDITIDNDDTKSIVKINFNIIEDCCCEDSRCSEE